MNKKQMNRLSLFYTLIQLLFLMETGLPKVSSLKHLILIAKLFRILVKVDNENHHLIYIRSPIEDSCLDNPSTAKLKIEEIRESCSYKNN